MLRKSLAVVLILLLLCPAALADREISQSMLRSPDEFVVTLVGNWLQRSYIEYNQQYGPVSCLIDLSFRENQTMTSVFENYEQTHPENTYSNLERQTSRLFGMTVMIVTGECLHYGSTRYFCDYLFFTSDEIANLYFFSAEPITPDDTTPLIASAAIEKPVSTPIPKSAGFTTIGDAEVRYDGASIRRVWNDYAVDISMTWRNLDDNPRMFASLFSVELYQDGIQLDSCYSGDKNTGTKLMRNAEVAVTKSFYLRNTTSPVTVMIGPFFSFQSDNKIELTLTFRK